MILIRTTVSGMMHGQVCGPSLLRELADSETNTFIACILSAARTNMSILFSMRCRLSKKIFITKSTREKVKLSHIANLSSSTKQNMFLLLMIYERRLSSRILLHSCSGQQLVKSRRSVEVFCVDFGLISSYG